MYRVLEINVDDHLYGGVYAMITNVIRLLPSDIQADIAAFEPFDKQEHIDALLPYDCHVYYVGSAGNKLKKQLTVYRNVKKLLSEQHYDVVHLHSDVAHKILIPAYAAQKSGIKRIILHAHAEDVEGNFVHLRRLFHRLCAIWLKRIPAVCLATSAEAGRWMYPWAPEGTVRIQNNGVEYARFYYDEETRNTVRRKLNKQNAFLLGAFGRFVYPKNPFYLLDILEKVHAQYPETHLLCIGEGPMRKSFQQAAKKRGMSEWITILDDTDHIERYYQAIDVLLLPSHSEGFGLVAVEAQISGTPVVASDNVPAMTKISDEIAYLPITPDAVPTWCDAISELRTHQKKDMHGSVDEVYDISHIVNDLASLYRCE